MALSYGFFDSVDGDRKYSAAELSSFFKGLISEGIFETVGNKFQVVASGSAGNPLQVTVKSGRAYLNSKWVENDGDIAVLLSTSPALTAGQARYHAIALIVDTSTANRNCRLQAIAGTPAASASAVKPTLTDTTTLHYHVLAYVKETYTSTTPRPAVKTADIENRRGVSATGNSATPFVVAPVNDHVTIAGLTGQWQSEWESLVGGLEAEVVRARAQAEGTPSYFQATNLQMLNVTVSKSSWAKQTTPTYAAYPYRASIANSEIVGNETPMVFFAYAQIQAGIYSVIADSAPGLLYLYASSAPSASITIPNIVLIKPMVAME